MKVVVETDGAARNNPGPAGIGAVVRTPEGEVLGEVAEGIGEATNNVAEYTAAIEGLRLAGDLGATEVELLADSNLLIEQLSGRYRVKAAHLRPLYEAVLEQAARFERVSYRHVPRERNTHADRLANVGVDAWLAARHG